MKRSYKLPLAAVTLLIAACNGDDNGKPTPGTVTPANSFSEIAARSADSEPAVVNDLQGLLDDIGAIFGGANGTPTDVQGGDTVADVVSRAGG